jgi:hypothetical protein
MEFSGYMELKPGVLATHKMFIEKGVKLCIAFGHFEGVAIPPVVFGELQSYLDRYDYTEGEDYIIIGYVLPNEAAVAALSQDFHGNVRVDWKGESIEGTFLDQIENAGDFALINDYTTGLATTFQIRHMVLTYGTPMAVNSIGVSVPGHLANLDAGLITSLLQSTRGGAAGVPHRRTRTRVEVDGRLHTRPLHADRLHLNRQHRPLRMGKAHGIQGQDGDQVGG